MMPHPTGAFISRLLTLLLACSCFMTNHQAFALPFVLGVRDSFMIAHSFHDNPKFGPAGKLHGATYTCDVEFSSKKLVSDTNWVIDIGKALDLLSQVLAKYNFQNLDEVFPDGTLTTTEFMAQQIHSDLCTLLKAECKEFQGDLCVKLWESHKAWASYSGKV
ncbi:6-pyruvoyl tetrahydropterin synthase [Seminavis robusta]|uniref:6-pyruvoyltetrahydropterin synthase n=1 Tax=Seminavis robusta TaxID=568900 RepID=A0A9N8EW91_9STRA|nr:6-pyruvoyl tetrahydropterin synthase [Seminavis robusta]|eukprot:Sro1947_g307150.1 6-pyruvoyl tetrahydropterin synthase (162) ;mRNA; r:11304-11789